jgi:hypothetical protein
MSTPEFKCTEGHAIQPKDWEEVEKLRAHIADLEEQDRQWDKTSLVAVVTERDALRAVLKEYVDSYQADTISHAVLEDRARALLTKAT